MARGRRTRSIRDLRDEHDALERQQSDDDELDEDEELEDDDEDDDLDEEDEEEVVVKKKKPAKVTKPRAKRTRTPKVVRLKVVWGVFNNSHQRVAVYEYKQKKEAEAHAAKLTESKPNNTHFIQPVKEPMETKEEKEKEK